MGLLRSSTRRLVGLAADSTESIATLPTVATADWPDRAAASLLGLAGPCRAIISLCSLDDTGAISDSEIAGVGSGPAGDLHRAPGGLSGRSDLDRTVQLTLRSRLQAARSLGFSPPEGFFEHDPLPVFAAPLQDLIGPESADPSRYSNGLFSGLGTRRIVVGLVRLSRAHPERVLVVYFGLRDPVAPSGQAPDTDADDAQLSQRARDAALLLHGVLPVLARRTVLAIGLSPALHGGWLTQREQRVLEMLTLGKSVREIAETLDRSPHTVHDHVKSLHRKLGASSRGELVARALGQLSDAERAAMSKDVPGFESVTTERPEPRASVTLPSGSGSATATARWTLQFGCLLEQGLDFRGIRRPASERFEPVGAFTFGKVNTPRLSDLD